MGIFTRFKDIVNSNVNSLLDKAENPDKMLKLMIQELEDTIIELKADCSSKMAEEIQYTRKVEEQKALLVRWENRAILALDKNNEELAKEALVQKRNETFRLEKLESLKSSCSDSIVKYKEEISILEEKLTSLKARYKEVKEREEKVSINNSYRHSDDSINSKFEDLEYRVDRLFSEKEFKIKKTTESSFESLEEEEAIEAELKRLKEGK